MRLKDVVSIMWSGYARRRAWPIGKVCSFVDFDITSIRLNNIIEEDARIHVDDLSARDWTLCNKYGECS